MRGCVSLLCLLQVSSRPDWVRLRLFWMLCEWIILLYLYMCLLYLSCSNSNCFLKSFPVRNHVSSICSTWGREHFKTFDGDVYQFPGMCEYNLASDCHESYQEFSVHMKRKDKDGNPTVSHVMVTISDLLFYLTNDMVTVNDVP